jgi:hypothetical protein
MRQVIFAIVMSLVLSAGAVWADAGLARHKQLYAVPVPGTVVIDGKLAEWDLSGQIEMYVVSETKEMQSAKFALMYDGEALYLSGVVRDPSPLMNRQDPIVNGNRGWDADSCQFRLTVDPAQAYPVKETAFDYRGKNAKVDTRDDIKHLILWHFTDRQEACLQMHMGMGYRVPRPEWAPHGVVPAALFQAKYLPAEDGRGYIFEYRIPWSTLGAKAPLKGGDLVAGTVQFCWGQTDGLKTAGGSAWAYDGMAGPGFVFQNAAVWGKLHFAVTGNLPKELVEAGVPAEKPLPLKFAYELPEDGQVTLQLFDGENQVRRILVAQADRRKGKNVELWDGMDDQGKPLLPGAYTCKGIIHKPIKTEFILSAHNSGQPPYPTDDNKGGWGGDHGTPTACSAIPGGMLLAWSGCEYGWGIIRVDLNGRKQWGSKQNSQFLANDGKRLFIYDPAGFQAAAGIRAMDLADGRPVNFGSGDPLLQAPPGGEKEANAATGLAYGAGKIYVSYAKRNLVGVFNAASGKLETTWTIPTPGALAARPDGSIVGISAGTLVAVTGGKVSPLNATELQAPAGVAVAPDGTIYVSNGGARQDIAVFDAAGHVLRRIGKSGGRPAVGDYDPTGVFRPAGIALDATGRLWVAEHADSPKRVSVWNAATGAFDREFFGASGYFGYAHINPAVPDEIYCHNVLWRVDWEKRTTTPISTIWRKSAADMVAEPLPDAYPQGFRSLTTATGQQFGIGLGAGDRSSVLYRREGNLFKPFMASFQLNRGKGASAYGVPELDDPKSMPDGAYLWQDANDDQRLQLAELHRYTERNFRLAFKALAPDLTIWADGGRLLKPVRRLANGQPVYDPANLEKSFLAGTPQANGYLWLDADGSVYTHSSNQRPSLAKWSPDGKLQWGYPSIIQWHNALAMPVVTAGKLYGMTGGLGVAGGFSGNMSYFGVCHVFDRNGIYTAALMKDGRAGGGTGPETGQPEGQGGQLVSVVTKPGAAPRTFLLAGGQDGRVTEVHGLDTVKALPERTVTLTAAEMKIAADALAEFNAKMGTNKLTIVNGRKALDTSTPVSKLLDGTRSFTARAARDEKNLYVSFEVASPYDLINANPEPTLLFKGGNCLDIQLATDPAADSKRKTPAPGDVRLLVTRQLAVDGKTLKPLVVLYRPKVTAFNGEAIVLKSPTGTESFDEIAVVDTVGVEYKKTGSGFKATVAIPLTLVGLTLQKGQPLRMDLGYLYGNATGSLVAARSYWTNTSFTANVTNDVPHESRLEPAQWGMAGVE